MALVHVLDTAKIKASGRLTKGEAPNGKAQFKFWVDDVEQTAVPVDLGTSPSPTGSPVTHEYSLKPVAADKPSYKLRYALFLENGTQVGEMHQFLVWPKKGKLTVKLDGTGAAVKTFKGVMKQPAYMGNKEKNTDIAGDGSKDTYEFDLHAGAEYTVEAAPPYTITDGADKTSSQREIKVKESFIAEFVNPRGKKPDGKWVDDYDQAAKDDAAKKNPILKHYVNLATSNNGWDARGNEITVEVGAKKEKPSDPRAGGAGKFIFFNVKFEGHGGGTKSTRNHPKTEVKSGENLAASDLTVVTDGVEYKGKVELATTDKTGKFKIDLGFAGGDACVVKIGGTEACGDAQITLVNWRKLEYELIYPDLMTNLETIKPAETGNEWKDLPKKLKKFVKERLGAVYIEYNLSSSRKFAKTDVTDEAHRYGFTDSKYLKESGPPKPRMYMDYFLQDQFNGGGIVKSGSALAFQSPQPSHRMRIYLAHAAYSATIVSSTNLPKKQEFKANMEALTHSFDGELVPPRNPKKGTKTLNLTGFEWKTCRKVGGNWSFDPIAPNDAPPLLFAPGSGTTLGTDTDRIIRVKDLTSGLEHDMHFVKPGSGSLPADLTPQEVTALTSWVNTNFKDAADKKPFRSAEGKLKLQLTHGGLQLTQIEAAKKRVETAFAAVKVCAQDGFDWNGEPLTGALEETWFKFETYDKLTVTLPKAKAGDPGHSIKPNQGVFIKFEFDNCYEINGAAAQTQQILVIPSPDADKIPDATAGGRSGTVCHELGHRMGMTIMAGRSKTPKGMTEAKHVDNGGIYYRNGGAPYTNGVRAIHVGPHCAHGIPDPDLPDDSFNDRSGDCIMFGSGDPAVDSRTQFCDTCKDYIKGRKLTSIIGDWSSFTAENS
jgi:hypothetical protein